LLEALEAVPKARDWGVTHARSWWTDFRARPEPTRSTEVETMTITVDLEQRAALDQRSA
jgi:hypothetical protein